MANESGEGGPRYTEEAKHRILRGFIQLYKDGVFQVDETNWHIDPPDELPDPQKDSTDNR